MLNQKNTDNILYNKPYQLVLWTISTKRKMHICTDTFTSCCCSEGEPSSSLRPLVSLHCGHLFSLKFKGPGLLKIIHC